MLLMTPKLIQQGVYTEYFSSLLAQKLISPKDERSVGFSDGASPSTRVSYYKHINLWCFCWCFFLLLHWMSCYNAKSCCDNRQDCLTFIYLQLKQSQIKRKTYRSYKLIILCCIRDIGGWLWLVPEAQVIHCAPALQSSWQCANRLNLPWLCPSVFRALFKLQPPSGKQHIPTLLLGTKGTGSCWLF